MELLATSMAYDIMRLIGLDIKSDNQFEKDLLEKEIVKRSERLQRLNKKIRNDYKKEE